MSQEPPQEPQAYEAMESVQPDENPILQIDPSFQQERNIVFHVAQEQTEEMLKITEDGFYVRGKKVADDRKVYQAFIEWMNITNQSIGQPLLEDVLQPKKKSIEFNRFDLVRETGIRMSEETERKIKEYCQAGHKVIRFKEKINGKVKNSAVIQLDIFGEHNLEELEKEIKS